MPPTPASPRRALALLLPIAAIAPTACSDDPPPGPEPDAGAAANQRLYHDFGVVPHGSKPEHVFEIALGPDTVGYHPAAFESGCTCAKAAFLLTRAGASEPIRLPRYATREHALAAGDRLSLSLTLDTTQQEPVDSERQTMAANVVLQRGDDYDSRKQVPLLFHYAIDAPIEVRPTPHVDIGMLPRTKSYREILELVPDRADPPVAFGPVRTSDSRLAAALRREDGVQLLDLTFTPDPAADPAPFDVTLDVETDLPRDYVLKIGVSGEIAPDIE